MVAARDLAGQRFGWLVVQRRSPERRGGRAVWVCLCACGAEKHITTHQLTGGHVTSCGCRRVWRGSKWNANATRSGRLTMHAFGRLGDDATLETL